MTDLLQKTFNKFETWLVAALTVFLIIMANFNVYWLWPIVSLLVLIYLLSRNLLFGLGLMAILMPFINWPINLFGLFNPPPIDILAVLMLVAYVIYAIQEKKWREIKWPSILFFGLFIVIGVISGLSGYFAGLGLKYILRFLILGYLSYVVLPANLLDKEEKLIKIIKLIFYTGLVITAISFGQMLYHLIWLKELARMLPPIFGSFAPLGWNQNVLAETLVVVWPLGVYLAYKNKNNYDQFIIYSWLAGFILLGALLTLSRAAWLTIAVEIILLVKLVLAKIIISQSVKHKIITNLKNWSPVIIIILLTVIYLMAGVLTGYESASSNANRLFQWQIGWEMYNRSPWLGMGPGSFIEVLNRDPYFFLQFGTDLEAHSLLLKLLAETGLLGLITFFGFIYLLFTKAIKTLSSLVASQKSEYILIACIIISALAELFFQFFNTSYFTVKMFLPLGLVATIIYLYGNKE